MHIKVKDKILHIRCAQKHLDMAKKMAEADGVTMSAEVCNIIERAFAEASDRGLADTDDIN